jgi:hypothetical protein
MEIGPQKAKAIAIAGGIVWPAMLWIRTSDSPETELIQRILLLGVLVIVPLGLSLVSIAPDRVQPMSYKIAILLLPVGAVAVVGSHFLNPGVAAAVLASIWLISTGFIALFGLWRLLS